MKNKIMLILAVIIILLSITAIEATTIDNDTQTLYNIHSDNTNTHNNEITSHNTKIAKDKTVKKEDKNTYYISTNGNKNNNGLTKDTAWDIDNGFNNIKSHNNSKLVITEGTYDIKNTITFNSTDNYNCEIVGENKDVILNGSTRILNIKENNHIKISNLTFMNVNINDIGAVVNNTGNLSINNCNFSHNTAFYKNGGAIYNNGSLFVNNSIFEYNTAQYGGAIYNDYGNLSLSNNTFNYNTAINSASGGAIYNNNYNSNITAYIVGNKFKSNTCSFNGGGALFNKASVIFEDNFVESCYGLHGGAIYNIGFIQINNNTFINNTAYNGPVLYNMNDAVLTNNIMSNNTASTKGGALYNMHNMTLENNNISNNEAPSGAGIYNALGNITIINSTLENNSATNKGGAIYNQANITLINNTIKYNHAKSGSGIYNAYYTIRHTTSDYMSFYLMYFLGNATIKDSYFIDNSNIEDDVIENGSEIYNQGQIEIINNSFINRINSTSIIYNNNLNKSNFIIGGLMNINDSVFNCLSKVFMNNGNLSIFNSTIKNSSNGVVDNNNILELDNSMIINNTVSNEEYVISNYDSSSAKITNNQFINNSDNSREMLFNNHSIDIISNNTFVGNYIAIAYENFTINTIVTNNIHQEIKFNYVNNIYNESINSGRVLVYINGNYYNSFNILNSKCDIAIKMNDLDNDAIVKYVFEFSDNSCQPLNSIDYIVQLQKENTHIYVSLPEKILLTCYYIYVKVESDSRQLVNGTLMFTSDSNIAPVNIINGAGTIIYNPPTVGNKTVQATYIDRDNIFLNSTITITTEVISKIDTVTVIDNINRYNDNLIDIAVAVKDENNNFINDGKVIFKINNRTLRDDNGKVIAKSVTNGIAKLENYMIPIKYHDSINITAIYIGDNNYKKSVSKQEQISPKTNINKIIKNTEDKHSLSVQVIDFENSNIIIDNNNTIIPNSNIFELTGFNETTDYETVQLNLHKNNSLNNHNVINSYRKTNINYNHTLTKYDNKSFTKESKNISHHKILLKTLKKYNYNYKYLINKLYADYKSKLILNQKFLK